MVATLIETLHSLSVLFYTSIYRILRVLIFANGKFLKISSFEISDPKKKTVESRNIRLMLLSRSTEKQAGYDLTDLM